MPNYLVAFIFIVVSNSIFGQNNKDSCAFLRNSRAFIEKADSNSIHLSDVMKGFILIPNDSTLKITSFHFSFSAQPDNGSYTYYASAFEGNKFDPDKYPVITKSLGKTETIFIDNIYANRGDSCFRIKSITYAIK
jgi:hypothetical protein